MQNSRNQSSHRLYADLAWTWPIISPPEEYADETSEIIELMNKHTGRKIEKLVNFGCGGGHNDFNLKNHFKVTGVDISEAMLNLARSLNPNVEYVKDDMRWVRLNRQYDAVTIFDSINYMCTPDDLKAAFDTAYAHLRPGGVMATYAEEWKETFQQNKTTHLVRRRDDIEVVLVENYYDPDPEDTMYEGNFIYLIRRSGLLTMETDYHRLGLFFLHTWPELMKEAGFKVYQEPSRIPNHSGDMCPIFVGVKIG